MVGPKPSVRVGDKFLMKENSWLTVTDYAGCRYVTVVFDETGYETVVEAVQIRRGTVRDYLKPSVYGFGFLGVGRHIAYTLNKPSWVYTRWINMLERCYSPEWHIAKPAYLPCETEEHWHNFQNFADWAECQVGYGVRGWQLDKDILVHGNKLYSRGTCCFVPNDLNSLLIKCGDTRRGSCVVGATFCESSGKFHAQCSRTGTTSSFLGTFKTEGEAFICYKGHKETYLQDKANKWQHEIDQRVYNALMCYEVLITD